MIGKTIAGRYKILKELGRGGMGVVYLAQDTKLLRQVAFKLLSEAHISDPEAISRFKQEAISIAPLEHPNIVMVYDMGEWEGSYYIVIQYIEGQSLKELISQGRMSLEKAIDISAQAGEGLKCAHQNGIIHRDIKPSNIMKDREGRVKILDFGLAKLKGSVKMTQTGALAGTVEYMSPEQLRGEKVDHRTDIFSLGIVLYEMLAGRHPFGNVHPDGLIYSILYEEAEVLSHINSEVPPRLEQIVAKALVKDREKRYQQVSDLLEDLKKRDVEPEPKPRPVSDKKWIAVLKFENKAPDPENDYFCEGMTDDIVTDLTKIEGIRVLGRNAADRIIKGDEPVDLQALGKRLKVDAILQGSVRKLGNQLRINVALVDVKEGFNLWAERYRLELEDVFKLQEEIAREIARALKIHLSPRDEEKLARKYRGKPEAYDYQLKARKYFYKFTKSDLLTAIQMFRGVLEIDPDYASAHAGLAESYIALIDRGYEKEPTIVRSILRNAEQSASTALDKDPLCAEACKALGLVYYKLGRYRKSKEQLLRALDIQPTYAAARADLGVVYTYLGDFERAEKERLLAYEQDPSLTFLLWNMAQFYLSLNRFSDAEKYIRKVLDLEEPSYWTIAHYILSRIYFYQRKFEAALEHMQKWVEVEVDEPFGNSGLASLYAALGDVERAKAKLNATLQSDVWDEDIIENLILTHVFLKDKNNVYDWIKKGMQENKVVWYFLEYNPLLEEFRKEDEFQRLLGEIKAKTMSESGVTASS